MKGDYSRITFEERKHYAMVLMQQGRVQLDADWNEQAIIQLTQLQKLASSLMGEHGGSGDGFLITKSDEALFDFLINDGNYYVGGVICRNENICAYTDQKDYPFPDDEKPQEGGWYLVYLDVWYRHITSIQDDHIREVALGWPDTATRVKTVWQVKVNKLENWPDTAYPDLKENFYEFKNRLKEANLIQIGNGRLAARGKIPSDTEDPCILPPEARYRGAENQFYRVEIHRGGKACTCTGDNHENCATFKWSRDNGSVVFPIRKVNGNIVTLEHIGRDDRSSIKPNDWVEVIDDDNVLLQKPGQLFQVESIDRVALRVTLTPPKVPDNTPLTPEQYEENNEKHPLLRRWDHSGVTENGALLVKQCEEDEWIDLEDGIQINFPGPENVEDPEYQYQTGDWWWIPARTATGDIEWPKDDNDEPKKQEPYNPRHSYAPLALIKFNPSGSIDNPDTDIVDLRRKFIQLWT